MGRRIEKKIFSTFDDMVGLEAEVARRRFQDNYSHEHIASELDIPLELTQQIAAGGLMKIKNSVYGSDSR